jgi:hypothetical protein
LMSPVIMVVVSRRAAQCGRRGYRVWRVRMESTHDLTFAPLSDRHAARRIARRLR